MYKIFLNYFVRNVLFWGIIKFGLGIKEWDLETTE
jgi:hypothetical protein